MNDTTSTRLHERRAVVCGSTQGIGRACAHELAVRGARITLVARDENALQKMIAELPPVPSGAHHHVCVDFSEPDAVRDAARELVAGEGAHEILINNTGGPPAGPVFDATPEDFVRALNMHVVCNQILVQALVPGMKAACYGRIINIVSTSVREPIANLGVSNTTRGAVASWAKTLSRELGPFAITVNNVLPGFTDTGRLRSLIRTRAEKSGTDEAAVEANMKGLIPLGRFADAVEIAAVVGFLASPGGSYVNGVSLPVDGGRLASI